jgi:hypothetical protein
MVGSQGSRRGVISEKDNTTARQGVHNWTRIRTRLCKRSGTYAGNIRPIVYIIWTRRAIIGKCNLTGLCQPLKSLGRRKTRPESLLTLPAMLLALIDFLYSLLARQGVQVALRQSVSMVLSP